MTEIIRGIVEKMPDPEYRDSPGLSPSSIAVGLDSMLHLHYAWIEKKHVDSDAMRFGRMAHTMLFEPFAMDERFAIWRGGHKRGKDWAEFKSDNDNKDIVSVADAERGELLCRRVVANPIVANMIQEGMFEVSMFSEDHGIQVKGRADWIDTRGGNLLDLKTCRSASVSQFGSAAGSLKYHVKMACYKKWFERCSGKRINGVYLIAAESMPPYDVVVYEITEDQLEDGWNQADKVIAEVAECLKTDTWNGVSPNETLPLSLPFWAMEDTPELDWSE